MNVPSSSGSVTENNMYKPWYEVSARRRDWLSGAQKCIVAGLKIRHHGQYRDDLHKEPCGAMTACE